MKIEEAIVGTRVRSLVNFAGVPKGTEGVIDEEYLNGIGIMVAWDLPNQPLPRGYCRYDGIPAIKSNILRDGFEKGTELEFLEKVQ